MRYFYHAPNIVKSFSISLKNPEDSFDIGKINDDFPTINVINYALYYNREGQKTGRVQKWGVRMRDGKKEADVDKRNDPDAVWAIDRFRNKLALCGVRTGADF